MQLAVSTANNMKKWGTKVLFLLQVFGQLGTLFFVANFLLYIATSLPRAGRLARSNKTLSYQVNHFWDPFTHRSRCHLSAWSHPWFALLNLP